MVSYRVIVFYDLPMTSAEERKRYRAWRKRLMESGFYQLQESVYAKRLKTKESYRNLQQKLVEKAPENAKIRLILMTENAFDGMDYLAGEPSLAEKILSSHTRIIEI